MDNTFTLITGASRGIGKSLAFEFARRGNSLILVARNKEELDSVAETIRSKCLCKVITYYQDLTEDGSSLKIAAWCKNEGLRIATLVNNAGFGLWGQFAQMEHERLIKMVQLNNLSLVSLTHALLPLLKQNKKSYLLNVGSTASFLAIPYFAVYAASKAFVLSFSRSLARELKSDNVSVSCLCPPSTESDFWREAGMRGDDFDRTAGMPMMSAEKVAIAGVNGLFKGTTVIVPGLGNSLMMSAARIFPGIATRIAGKVMKP